MKFTVVIEDTWKGIRATAYMEPNQVCVSFEESLSARIIAVWTEQIQEMERIGALVVEPPEDE